MGRTETTTWAATHAILDWLEHPPNFQLITVSAVIAERIRIAVGAKSFENHKALDPGRRLIQPGVVVENWMDLQDIDDPLE